MPKKGKAKTGVVYQVKVEDKVGLEVEKAKASPPPIQEEEKPYTLGTWAGMRQWQCKLCPWDTLEGEAAMLEHLASAHRPPKPKVLVADKSGKEKRVR